MGPEPASRGASLCRATLCRIDTRYGATICASTQHIAVRHYVTWTQHMVRRYVALTQHLAIHDAIQPERESRGAGARRLRHFAR